MTKKHNQPNRVKLSIIIPAYNEQKKIVRDLEAARRYLETKPFWSEIIVVNDGSSDHTHAVVSRYIENLEPTQFYVRLLSYPRNRGKGFAIRYGVLQAQGEKIAFVDAGLCVPYRCLNSGLEALNGDFDYAIGSRRVKGTKVHHHQPKYRQWGSRIFAYVVKILMGVNFVSDTQCGFKIYKSAAAKAIFSKTTTNGFMFDVEALLIAKRLGFRVVEFPVEWSNDADTRYHPVWGTIRNFKELFKIRLRTLFAFRNLTPQEGA